MTPSNEITFGDLINVDGYGDRPFFVDGWTVETIYEPDKTWSETWFDITCAWTGEYMMAELSDIKRICGAEAADDYLMYHATPPVDIKFNLRDIIDMDELFSEVVSDMMYKPERQPTARELSAQEADRRKKARKERAKKIDRLLDEYKDYKALADEFGDEEYKARVEYISVKLTEIIMETKQSAKE